MRKILGGHILKRAMSLTGYEEVLWLKWVSREKQPNGVFASTYAPEVCIKASVQPMQRTLMALSGLDLNKNYVTIYSETFINDLERDRGPDRFKYGGNLFELVSDTDWKKPQGFVGSLAVQIQ